MVRGAKPLRNRRLGAIALAAAFVASRALFRTAGNSFAINLSVSQFVDPLLLRRELWRSLLYLNSQPPLLNLSLGLGLRFFPHSYAAVFGLSFAAMGLLLVLGLFALLSEMGVPIGIGLAVSLAFCVSPGTMMIESWFFDTYPSAVLLTVAALSLLYYCRGGRRGLGVLFVACTAALIFLNSTFQAVWMLGLILLLWQTMSWERFRPLLVFAAVAMVLVALLYVKNFFVFDSFTSSSWLGMNLAKVTVTRLGPGDREQLVRAGSLSPVSLIDPFSPLDDYRGAKARSGIAVLDEIRKSGGTPNFNNAAYIGISRQYLRDDAWVVLHRPRTYLKGVMFSTAFYFSPAGDYAVFAGARARIPRWVGVYRRLVKPLGLPWAPVVRGMLGAKEFAHRLEEEAVPGVLSMGGPSLVLAILLPVLLLYGGAQIAGAWRRGGELSAEDICLTFIVFAILYVSAVDILFECGENNRLRYVVDPLYTTMAGMFAASARRALGRVLSRTSYIRRAAREAVSRRRSRLLRPGPPRCSAPRRG